MKEIHKLLVGKLKPFFKEMGFLKLGESSWYKPYDGFSAGLEIQKSQWSEDIYLNYYFFVHDSGTKPKKSDPYITGRIYGPSIDISNDEFNEVMELSEGNILEKTNRIVYFVDNSIELISWIDNITDLKNFVKSRKLNPNSRYENDSMTHNDIKKVLGLE